MTNPPITTEPTTPVADTALPTHVAEALPTSVRGPVLLPGDTDWDMGNKPWNREVDQQVAAVVEAADADDVAALVRFARTHGLAIATQPSGHGATGRATGAVLLRTGRLDRIDVDPVQQTARVGAGVRSGDLQRAAAAHGLTALPGSSPVVTVTGTALGGGLSWFGRAFGWIADSVLAFDVVDADGNARTVNPGSDPELYWALRGGGGELAVVTALEVRLHPAPQVFGGRQLWSADHAHQVAQAFRAMTETAPPGLTLWFELLNFPGADPMVAIDSTHLGDEATARELMSPTDDLPTPLSDSRASISVADLGAITGEPTEPSAGRSHAELLTRLDDDVFATLLDQPLAPVMAVQLRHLGGALAGPSDGPHGPLVEPYALYLLGPAPTPELARAVSARQAELVAFLPISGRKPVTFLNPTEELSDALSPASLERLRRLKDERDPDRIIRGNFAVAD
ncbi:FAD-binding oxidoreductase [Propionibacteriaceae bacterium Y2011]|uniref:FAD-binding oxidoreductase n=1 Tax=Microlunatus sp. Y2014 TaxID=3418488 RepID=UPI003B4FDD6D